MSLLPAPEEPCAPDSSLGIPFCGTGDTRDITVVAVHFMGLDL